VKRRGSVQANHLGITAIEDGVVHLSSGGCRAVLEVGSVNFGLQGEGEQEALLASYASFLNSLTFPVQVLVRVLPVDIEHYVKELEQRTRQTLAGDLAYLAKEYLVFIRLLASHRTLLDRRFYLIVTAEGAGIHPRSWFRRRAGLSPDVEALRKQLTFRCESVERELGRCGLAIRRLSDVDLAQLYYSCWCPELARVQRLQRNLTDYSTLVVRAAHKEESACLS